MFFWLLSSVKDFERVDRAVTIQVDGYNNKLAKHITKTVSAKDKGLMQG